MLILTTLCSLFFIKIKEKEREGYYDSSTSDMFGLLNCSDLGYCVSFSDMTFESFFLNIVFLHLFREIQKDALDTPMISKLR